MSKLKNAIIASMNKNSYNNSNTIYSRSGWQDTSDVLTSVKQVHMCEVLID